MAIPLGARARHGSPAHNTWARLCGDASVDTIVARLEGGDAAPPFSCYPWNARWVKASAPKAALKRQFVLDKVLAGQVVCVQETHWSEAQGFAWAGLFPASQVAFAHAHTVPRGVTRGGVAVLVPHRTRIVSQRVLAPGCAVECCIDYGEEGMRTFLVCVPPAGVPGGHARRPLGCASSSGLGPRGRWRLQHRDRSAAHRGGGLAQG